MAAKNITPPPWFRWFGIGRKGGYPASYLFTLLVRPMGRDKAKKEWEVVIFQCIGFRHGGNDSNITENDSNINRYNLNLTERLTFDKEKEAK